MEKVKNKVEYIDINKLVLLKNNPRKISKENMSKLKQSIKDNPDYFEARPLIISNRTGENVILAGNQRYKASQKLGLTKVPCIILKDLTEEKEKEIIIRDNVELGDWDCNLLSEWNVNDLNDWGVDLKKNIVEKDEEEKNKNYLLMKELKKKDNFIIMKFENDIDFLNGLSFFDIQKELLPSTKTNGEGKLKRFGLGLVIDGTKIINKIIDYENKL